MAANTLQFPRGDGVYHTFNIPLTSWTPGGLLFFSAKQAIDDDDTDSAAVIVGQWDDTATSQVVLNGITYVQYNCYFPASATDEIVSDGAASLTYLGDFRFVPTTGIPVTFPAQDPKINVEVIFNVTDVT